VLTWALEVTIENCTYQGEPLYEVRVEDADGVGQPTTCTVEASGDCSCTAGTAPGLHRVTVTHGGIYLLYDQEVTVAAGPCGPVTEHLTYEATPVVDLPPLGCAAADEQLTACGLSSDEARCIKEGLKALDLETGEDFAVVADCINACISSPSCDELNRDLCAAPASEITDYELCLADCLDVSDEDVAKYAPELGPSSYCNLGGAGGAGG
jgi:hypothetical protein